MLNGPPPASMRLGGGRLCTRPAAEIATTRRATGTRELQLTLLALDGTTCNTGPPPLLCDPGWVVLPVVVEDMGQWDRRQKQQWEEENTHTHTHTHTRGREHWPHSTCKPHLQWCRRLYMVNSALHTQQLSAMSSGTQSDASTDEEPMMPFTDRVLLPSTVRCDGTIRYDVQYRTCGATTREAEMTTMKR